MHVSAMEKFLGKKAIRESCNMDDANNDGKEKVEMKSIHDTRVL